MRDKAVQLAIELAAAEFAPLQWVELPQGSRAAAIYAELRKLDTMAVGGSADVGGPPKHRRRGNRPAIRLVEAA